MKFSTILTAVLSGFVLAAPAPAPAALADASPVAAPGEQLRQTHDYEPTCREAYDDCERNDEKICCPYNDTCRTFDDDDCMSSWLQITLRR